jgi:hypothetical protein
MQDIEGVKLELFGIEVKCDLLNNDGCFIGRVPFAYVRKCFRESLLFLARERANDTFTVISEFGGRYYQVTIFRTTKHSSGYDVYSVRMEGEISSSEGRVIFSKSTSELLQQCIYDEIPFSFFSIEE